MAGLSDLFDGMHGVIFPFGGTTAPNGFLMCYGQAVSRTTYAALFATIGTAFGAGDGSTTFNVPDLRGRVPAGMDNMGGVAANRLTTGGSGVNGAALGAAGGAETHTLTVAELAAHGHEVKTRDGAGATPAGLPLGWQSGGSAPNGSPTSTGNTAVTSTGGDGAHNNTQPTLVLNYVIKT